MSVALPAIYGITATALFEQVDDFLVQLERALASNVLGMLQVREKRLSGTQLADFASSCLSRCHEHGCKVIINHSDPRLARSAGADGIHLSSAGLRQPARDTSGLLVGASCHNEEELMLATGRHGCDFVVLSPVLASLTHVDASPLGWKRFSLLAAKCPKPVYALGGLQTEDVSQARRFGACGISSMRDVWGLPVRGSVDA